MKDYTWFGNNRKNIHINAVKGSGGVGILIKSSVLEQYNISIVDKEYDGILCLKLVDKTTDYAFVLCACYLPPEHSIWGRDPDLYFGHLLHLLYENVEADGFYICGDFNSRIADKCDIIEGVDDNLPNRVSIDQGKNKHGESLLEFLKQSNCCIVNGRLNPLEDKFTFVNKNGKSVVDYVIVRQDDFKNCTSFSVEPCEQAIDRVGCHSLIGDKSRVPDHSMLIFKFRARTKDYVDQNRQENSHTNDASTDYRPNKKYLMNRIPSNFMESDMVRAAINELIYKIESARETQEAVNVLYDDFCKVVIEEMNASIPSKLVSPSTKKKFKYYKPYWDEELANKWSIMAEKKLKWEKQKGICRNRREMHLEFTTARDIFDKLLSKKEREYRQKAAIQLEEISNEPSKFWSHIKKLGPKKSKSIPMEVYLDNDEVSLDRETVLKTWQQEFSNLYNTKNSSHFDEEFYSELKAYKAFKEDLMLDPLYCHNEFVNKDIDLSEIEKVCNKAKDGKAVGIDKLPNEVLKSEAVKECLCSLFQLCLESGRVPDVWLKAIIYPIPKNSKNDPRVPLNYRGISLLSTTSKLFTSLVNNRILGFLELKGKLEDEQNGFRWGRSCSEHIFTLTSLIRNRLANKKSTFTAFIDFKKAFDLVDREALLARLIDEGIDGRVYGIIKQLYSNTSSCVQVNNAHTEWFDTSMGVRQGDSMSPTLFAIFINDLAKEIKKLNCGIKVQEECISILLYADDIVLTSDNEANLQRMLNVLYSWCKKWRVQVNRDKSQVMHFRPQKTKRSEYNFCYGNNTMPYIDSYKYLGIVLNEFLDYRITSSKLAESAGRALGCINNRFKLLKNMGLSTYETLFNKCVLPVLNYGAEIWGGKEYPSNQQIQNRAMRFYLGVHKFAPTLGMLGDLGWIPIKFSQYTCMINFWNRLVQCPQNRLLYKVFLWDFENCNNNWCGEVKRIFEELDMLHIFENKEPCNLDDIKIKFTNMYKEHWESILPDQIKLRTYNKYKTSHGPDKYLKLNLSRLERSLVAQFRLGILPLNIEAGRFRRLKLEDRICPICHDGIEDECHFLFTCPLYTELRVKLISTLQLDNINFDELSNFEKLRILFTTYTRQTVKYICQAFAKRKKTLYVIQ